MIRRLYQCIANLIGPAAVLAASFRGRFGGRWRERLGLRFAPHRSWDRPRLWFHAASVGEARSAAAVIRAYLGLRPQAEIFLSVGTPAGLEMAEKLFRPDPRVTVMAAPLDFWGAPGRAMARLNPDLLIILETELWPQLIFEAKNHGARLMLAAGRLSERSFKRYQLVRAFMRDLLDSFDLIAPAGQLEFELFAALGAPCGKLKIMGNPKFDRLLEEADSQNFAAKKAEWRAKLWGESPGGPLIVAGSTHPGEEAVILEAWLKLKDRYPALKLLIAPRHLNRVPEILVLAQAKGRSQTASQAVEPAFQDADILILDSIGQLSAVYGLADIAIVGGSFLKGLLGHNPLEPAAVGSPLIFGPFMASFKMEAEELLNCGGALKSGPETLARDLGRWLEEPALARSAAQAALKLLRERRPAGPALALAADKIISESQAGLPS